ncbi:MAG: pyruvate kinase [Candidatus Altiarchaeota archaeon]
MKKTKILCTIGPASSDRGVLTRMHKAGMNGVRINTAFGTVDEYRKVADTIRKVADIPVLMDLKGPEIRLKCRNSIEVEKGGSVWIGSDKGDEVSFNRNILSQLRIGDELLLNKGRVSAKVSAKKGGRIRLTVCEECVLKDGGGVNIPGRKLKIPTLSDNDLDIIRLVKELKLDYVALSFTRDERDIANLKRALGGYKAGIIAKIENQEGVDNADAILAACDGLMIARGDLGIEIPPERIPLIQKDLINKVNRKGKLSIVATEMLQSMENSPEPTRAETSDVANAILDGSDVVMLSGESAVGKYPVESVKTMTKIALEVETHMPRNTLAEDIHDKIPLAMTRAVAAAIDTVDVDKIVVATRSGYTAMLISDSRIGKDIIAITDDQAVCRRLHLVYAVTPAYHEYFKHSHRILRIAKFCAKAGLVRKNDLVLFTAGLYTDKPTTNIVQLHRIDELLRYRG